MSEGVVGSHGSMGMTTLKGDWERDYYAYPDIFEIGCAGRISLLTPLPDGRYNLRLDGLSEFRVVREIRDRSYRQAQIQWCPTPEEALDLDNVALTGLRDLLVAFLASSPREVWNTLVDQP